MVQKVEQKLYRRSQEWLEVQGVNPLTVRGFSVHIKGMLYMSCVRNALLYSNETWPVKNYDMKRLWCTEKKSVVKWM